MADFTENPKRLSASNLLIAVGLLALLFGLSFDASGQRVAVVTPETDSPETEFSANLSQSLARRFKIIDSGAAETAFRSFGLERVYNLTTSDAKNAGAAIGADFFVLVARRNQPRYSFEKKEYLEAYAALYVISSRTGRLVQWKMNSVTAPDERSANRLILETVRDVAGEIETTILRVFREELGDRKINIAELPEENSPEFKGFRPPVPYKRIPPPYTATANLYSITATVDIEVDFDTDGRVTRTEIVRWAGYGLDESVDQTVRKMNWRPAFANGKATPIRVLLRYNFKKIEKEGEP